MKKYVIDESVRNNLVTILNNGIFSIRHGEVADMISALLRAEEYKEEFDLINNLEEELAERNEKIDKLKKQIEVLEWNGYTSKKDKGKSEIQD